jgi:hypothetical protein
MNSANPRVEFSSIQPATDDVHDRPYQFGKPLSYLSERQQVRLLIVRGRIQEQRLLKVGRKRRARSAR